MRSIGRHRFREGQQRERSAAELVQQFGAQMRATARRYSANADDADDACQRTAEILLRVRPTGNDDQVLRWLRTTVKREAFAVGAKRTPVSAAGEVPEEADRAGSAADRVERLERLRLGAEALGRLKPQEVRALLLRAEGLTYKEICAETGWTYTKVNRCVTEGRRAFLDSVDGIESGAECERVAPALSALADGEAKSADLLLLRPHLGGCPKCRATLREYRQVPGKVAALVPPVALADGGGGGPIRTALEHLIGAAHDRIAVLGERGHQLAEAATGQKLAAIGASAAVLAGGGAATVEVVDRGAQSQAQAEQPTTTPPTPAAPAPPQPPPTASAEPTPEPPASPAPPQPAPSPSNEFAPEASAPAPAQAEFGPSRGGGGGGGEFAP
jgi:RNA polymerase sigma factor (sigma-70 family)